VGSVKERRDREVEKKAVCSGGRGKKREKKTVVHGEGSC